jgi:hypothetical protein
MASFVLSGYVLPEPDPCVNVYRKLNECTISDRDQQVPISHKKPK